MKIHEASGNLVESVVLCDTHVDDYVEYTLARHRSPHLSYIRLLEDPQILKLVGRRKRPVDGLGPRLENRGLCLGDLCLSHGHPRGDAPRKKR